ncbi:cytochrome P450 [Puniceibacterium sp. IMCC21224]|uniref:cytochrome P450 n=1 Tax=Puniceibacterium sp. IMCC21224 TaxID=1618204 RepID=UPI00064D9051|nr:cytochrome P450 [Puniceibacterium sp. IMCC21224]KMK67610.1 cytochrome P450 [Puniceibacterium sp. IMCC21224]
MQHFTQGPADPAFNQNPYPLYARMRAAGDLVWWQDYAMPCATSQKAVQALLRDRRFGREVPPELVQPIPTHLAPFYAVEAHSMLELEPPRHTRLRSLVLRAFTSRRIAGLEPEISTLCHQLIDALPAGGCDLLPAFAQKLPVIVIARLLGVPDDMAGQLMAWSNAMVAMYQARRSHSVEIAAATAAAEFADFLRDYVNKRRATPRDDLITQLITAEEVGDTLSTDELITTCILLLNAGHEATVHTLGNGLRHLLLGGQIARPETAAAVAEEILRFDPPLHMFTRYAYEDVNAFGHDFRRGDQVGLLLASANRDDRAWPCADRFDPARHASDTRTPQYASFGGGLHFCVGAPLARLELQVALPILFARLPALRLAGPPIYATSYHFHGLEALRVTY